MRPSNPARTSRFGFTLIELLVVISIIALLIGILLPSLSSARKQARSAKCSSNIRSMGIAAYAFFAETNGLIPELEETWMSSLGDKLDGTVDEFRLCPETGESVDDYELYNGFHTGSATNAWRTDADNNLYTYKGQYTTFTSSYGLNGFFYSDASGPDNGSTNPQLGYAGRGYGNASPWEAWFGKLERIPNPSKTPIFADCNWRDAHPHQDDTVPTDLSQGWRWDIHSGYSNPYMMGRMVMNRHKTTINVGFTDGHVSATKLGELWTLEWSRTFEVQDDIVID